MGFSGIRTSNILKSKTWNLLPTSQWKLEYSGPQISLRYPTRLEESLRCELLLL